MSLASDELGWIYVRVPRTASTAFTAALLGRFLGLCSDVAGVHATAGELSEIWGDKWHRYATFGFVRNPWDWFVSRYLCGMGDVWPGNRMVPHDTPGTHWGQRTLLSFPEWLVQQKKTPRHWLDGVDRVFRMEDLNLPEKVNVTRDRPHYREFYNDQAAAWVANKCVWEIEFGYAF